MPLYLHSGQVPELRGLPGDLREELLEAGVYGLSVTARNLAVVGGPLLAFAAVGLALALLLGRWVAFVWLPAGVLLLHVLLLNLAAPRIRALARERRHTEGRGPG